MGGINRRWSIKWSFMLVAVAAISGCASSSLHLHSAAREDQGKAAQDRWDAAYKAAQDVVTTRKERTQKLFAEDVAVRERLSSTATDGELFKFAVATAPEQAPERTASRRSPTAPPARVAAPAGVPTIGSELVKPIELAAAANKVPAELDLLSALNATNDFERDLQKQQATLRKFGGPADFSCTKWNEPAFKDERGRRKAAVTDGNDAKNFADVVSRVDKLCPANPANRGDAALLSLDTSKLPQLLRSDVEALRAKRKKLADAKDAQAIDRVALANALSDYRAAVDGNTKQAQAAAAPVSAASAAASAASAPPAAIQEAGKRASDLIAKLHAFGDMFSLKFLSEESTKGIDDFLASLASPKDSTDPATTSRDRAALALVTLSKTSDAWQAAQRDIDAVGARPLAMIQDIETLKAQRATLAIAAEHLSVDIQERKVRVRVQQAKAYAMADVIAKAIPRASLDQTLQTATDGEQGSLTIPERKVLLRAAGQYWYGHGYLEQQLLALQTKDRLLAELRKAGETENALAQWDALIRAQVDLLAAWSQTGVKGETISQGINALLLLWIGLGVH